MTQLSVSHFVSRRQSILKAMLPNSVCVVPAGKLVTRSNDTEYPFRQDSDFYYLTGFPEPDALLVLTNSEQFGGGLHALFCLPKDEMAEIWQGKRIGPEAATTEFGFDQCHNIEDALAGLVTYLDGHDNLYLSRGQQSWFDQLIDDALTHLRSAPKQTKIAPSVQIELNDQLHEMRLIKSDAEIDVMQRAAEISCEAHKQAMRTCQPGQNEYHLEAQLHFSYAMHGAKHPAYGTIVGNGDNACILHYTQNDCELKDGALVLIDSGAELHGYAADITRTFPVNGKFSEPQRQLYQLVLDAQLAALPLIKPGGTFKQASDVAIEVLTSGLIELGLLSGSIEQNIEQQLYRQYFMHGLGHWLGLDVHDVGKYKLNGQDRPFEPGMVLTIEPGLYVSPNADVDEQWRGIGIRIEDNIVITQDSHRVLTDAVPKTIEQIEALMAE